jgi:PAS domain S-box-containing protein
MTLSKPRILAIDDTPVNLLTLGAALKNEFDLQIAISGEAGIAQALRSPPDLILLDIMMPGMDGFETCRRIKSHPQLKDIPLIFVTALNEIHSEIRGLELGALDYIAKPIQVETARQRIRNLVERESLRQQVMAQRDQLETEISSRKLNQRRVEQLLIEQKAMLDNELVGIVRVANRVILWANPAFEKMLGYGPGELAGTPTRRNYPNEQASQALAAQAYPILAQGKVYRTQTQQVRRDGTIIWVDMNGAMLDTNAGESLWAFLDITEQELAAQALAQEKMMLQAILDNAPMGIWMAEPTGKVKFVNQTFCASTGIAEQHFLQAASYADLLPATVSPTCLQSDQECLAQADGVHLSTETLPFVDGKDHLLEITKVKLTHPQGTVMGVIGLAVDITERKAAAEKLELAASVFGSAREGIFITDTFGSIIDVNQAFTRITGYERDDVLGKTPHLMYAGHQGKDFYDELWQQLIDKGHWYGEIWNRRKDGGVYAEMLNITTVRDAQGKAEHFVALFSDITALKEHEKELNHIAHYDILTNLPNRVLLADPTASGHDSGASAQPAIRRRFS